MAQKCRILELFIAVILLLLLNEPKLIKSDEPPSSALPNIEYLGCGYDSLSGQPVIEALRFPVINLTYEKNQTADISGVRYTIPDQAYGLSDPEIDSTSFVQIFTTTTSVSQGLSESLSAGFGEFNFIAGMFSESQQTTFFNERSSEFEDYSSFTNLRVKSWKTGIISPVSFNLTSDYLSFLSYLPNYFNSTSCPIYKKIIAYYGTHVLYQSIFGGDISMTSSFSQSTYSSTTESDLSLQFSLLTFNGELSSTQQNELTQLNSEYSSSILLVGGDPSQYQVNQWNEWASTVPSNPIPVSMDLRIITSILPNKYSYIKDAYNDAINAYLLSNIQTNVWTTKASYPSSVGGVQGASLNGSIYVMGGSISNVNQYDPELNIWNPKQALPYSPYYPFVAALNNVIYCGGGASGSTYYSNFYEYDPSSNNWNSKASMPNAAANGVGVSVNGIFYAIGGINYYDNQFGIYAYDPTSDSWSSKGNLLTNRFLFGAAVLDDTIYIFGGQSFATHYPIISTAEKYNTTSGEQSYIASLPQPLVAPAGTSSEGLVYCVGGQDTNYNIVNTLIAYDPISNSWSYKASMPNASGYLASATIDNTIYAIAGHDSSNHNYNYNQMYTAGTGVSWC